MLLSYSTLYRPTGLMDPFTIVKLFTDIFSGGSKLNLLFPCSVLRLTESGIMRKLFRDLVYKSEFCMDPKQQPTELVPLKMTDFLGLYMLFGAGKRL